MTARCLNCGKPLTPYKPPTRDVPTHLGVDPYCSRPCLEQHLGVRPREGLKA